MMIFMIILFCFFLINMTDATVTQTNELFITTTCFIRPCETIKEREIVTQPDDKKPFAKLPNLDSLLTTPASLWLRDIDMIHISGIMSCNVLVRLLPILKKAQTILFDSWWSGEVHCLQFNLPQYSWVKVLEKETVVLENAHVEIYPNTNTLSRGVPTLFKIHGRLFYPDNKYENTAEEGENYENDDVHVLYLFKSPPSRMLTDPPRVIEILTSISSLLHYRTGPVTIHIAGNVFDKQVWFDPFFQRQNYTYNFIDLQSHPIDEYYLHNIPTYIQSGHRDARLKLVVDQLMPSSVKKVLVLDYDTLILVDVCRMMERVFDMMDNTSTFIAMAGEMASYYFEYLGESLFAYPATKSWDSQRWNGLNSGVIFMNLEEMRRQHWNELWYAELKNAKLLYPDAVPSVEWFLFGLGDQTMFNWVFKNHPAIFFELDNTYNFQLYHISKKDPSFLKMLVCQKAEYLKILHGNSYMFMDDESILKKRIWNAFADPLLPNYTRLLGGPYSNDIKNRTHSSIVAALKEWQYCY